MISMKRIIIICLVLSGLVSCSKMLEEKPEYTIASTNVFNDASSAQLALNACYGLLLEYPAYGQEFYELTIGPSGLAWGQTNGSDQDQLASLNVLPTTGTVNRVWAALYKVISECNALVEFSKNGTLPESQKAYYLAQARFIRAMCYFNLTELFGDVPLRLSITTPNDLNMARTPKADVYRQIAEDWLYAAQNLKTKAAQSGTDIAMAVPTKYAAYAFLAKLYFKLGSADATGVTTNWQLAKQYGDSVLTSGGYSLEPNFNNLFRTGAITSPEVIFQLNASTTLVGRGNRTNWVFSPASATSGISFGRFRSTKGFHDYFMGTYLNDPRIEGSFISRWIQPSNNSLRPAYPRIAVNATTLDSIKYPLLADPKRPTKPELQTQNPNLATRFTQGTGNHEGWPYYKKYYDVAAVAQNSNKRLLVYRYADFLLLMADVYNELGQQAQATTYINLVLTRARSSAAGATQPANIAGALTQDALRDRIFFERLFELAGEPQNFSDARRRGIVYFKKVLETNNLHPVTQSYVLFSAGSAQSFKDRMFNNGNLTDDFLRKNLLLPIPQNEINTNNLIPASAQNFGY